MVRFHDGHNRNKVSACLIMDADVFDTEYEGSHLLIIRVPRAHYSKRPFYLTQNPFGHTCVRRHEGDCLLSDDEVRKMFSDADIATHPLDGKIYKHFTLEKNFDTTTIRQYRQVFNLNHEGHASSYQTQGQASSVRNMPLSRTKRRGKCHRYENGSHPEPKIANNRTAESPGWCRERGSNKETDSYLCN